MPYRNLSTVPVYKKALALCHTSRELASYFSYNKDLLHLYSNKNRNWFVEVIKFIFNATKPKHTNLNLKEN